MNERSRLMLLGPIAGFLVVVAFGVGVIATAAYETDRSQDGVTATPVSTERAIEVELGDLSISPETLTAAPGPLTIQVHNKGAIEHNFAIEGVAKTPMLAGGESFTLRVPAIDVGEYEFICEVAGHADGGMRGTLTVAGDGAVANGSSGQGNGMAGTPEEMVEHDAARTATFPAETKGKGGVPLKPKVLANGTKVFELTAEAIEWETEPGKVVEAYAYNGMVPGPQLEAELGDRVRIVLHNELPEPTTIHNHGLTVPAEMDGVPVISQDAVLPGESFTYEFTVKNAGSNMYHSHFNAQKQVPMGLLGAFVVPDPKDPPADLDYTMVLNDGPLGYTLNGKGFPATEPLAVAKGDVVRIRYMNEGMQIHPMHLHGMAQTVVAKDGHLLKQRYKADTIMVAPGERVDVLVKADQAGAWAFHCHILNHAEGPDGMFGMVTALIVE
jgi:manganese oxidase